MQTQTIPTETFAKLNAAFGVTAGRNSLPQAPAPKREVSVAASATRLAGELLAMRRQLDVTEDRALIAAIAAAEKALIGVQIEAGAVRVMAA